MVKNTKLRCIILILVAALAVGACQGSRNTNLNSGKNTIEMKENKEDILFPKGEKLSNDWFTGDAFLMPLSARDKNNDFALGSVTFTPGARTNWHTHPKGQILIITAGEGFYQEKDKPAQRIKKGDVVNIPENLVHWHGATADTMMVHIAITNFSAKENVSWGDPVTDQAYQNVNKPSI